MCMTTYCSISQSLAAMCGIHSAILIQIYSFRYTMAFIRPILIFALSSTLDQLLSLSQEACGGQFRDRLHRARDFLKRVASPDSKSGCCVWWLTLSFGASKAFLVPCLPRTSIESIICVQMRTRLCQDDIRPAILSVF